MDSTYNHIYIWFHFIPFTWDIKYRLHTNYLDSFYTRVTYKYRKTFVKIKISRCSFWSSYIYMYTVHQYIRIHIYIYMLVELWILCITIHVSILYTINASRKILVKTKNYNAMYRRNFINSLETMRMIWEQGRF